MRLFIGVELDDRVRSAAAAAADRLRSRLTRVSPGLQARWIPPENLHITVWFLGEVPDADVPRIEGSLTGAPLRTAVFDLALAGCGAFPPSGAPRVFWIGVGDGGARMIDVYREIGERLAPLGFLPERRGYTAHLTLARVRDPGRGAPVSIRRALAEEPADCGPTAVSVVTLFRSRLSPKGAVYEPLLRVPLS
jgi:RNA 2',3'-cyclic 3'-phosphodiesterase